MEHEGTPELTVSNDDELPLTIKNCFRSNKYDWNHSIAVPGIP